MDILKEEYKNHMCEKHPNQQLLFLNTNLMENNIQDSLYYCEFCLSENLSLQCKDMISIKHIIDCGDKNIIQKWPPINNHDILKEIIQTTLQEINRDAIYSRITDCFTELKEEIMRQLDQIQKKIINKVSNSLLEFDQTFEQYQSISKIDSLRSILQENQKNYNMSKTEDLKQFIQKFQSEKGKNTQLLEQLLKKNKQLVLLFSGQYQLDLKDSLIQYFKKLNSFIILGNNKESVIDEKIRYSRNSEQELEKQLTEINKKIKNALSNFSDFSKFEESLLIQDMIQSDFEDSKNINILKHQGIISLISKDDKSSCQLYSDIIIDQHKIYEFIIGFQNKPKSRICIGFEQEALKNRSLGQIGKNSFILGVQNSKFCKKLLLGEKNFQAICEEEFVQTIVIQILLSENKFYISDYPQKRSVNCMDDTLYKFQQDKDYRLTIFIQNQQTQVDIISSRILDAFTII